jgi:hypothetical protein
MENALEKWDSMKQAIEEAKTVLEVSRIRDKAEAIRYTLRLAGESREVVRKAEEIKLRAERRAGELLKAQAKAKAGRHEHNRPDPTGDYSYKKLGIDSRDASRWQRIASIPRIDFEKWLNTAPEITSSGALSIYRAIERQREQEEAIDPEDKLDEVEEELQAIDRDLAETGIRDETHRHELFERIDELDTALSNMKKVSSGKDDAEDIASRIVSLGKKAIKLENNITNTNLASKSRLSFLPKNERKLAERIFSIIRDNLDGNSESLIACIIEELKQS